MRGVNLNATKLEGEEPFDEEKAFRQDFGEESTQDSAQGAGDESGGDDISAIAASLEGSAKPYVEPVITGLRVESDEDDSYEDEPWDAIRLPRDSRTLEEMDMGPVHKNRPRNPEQRKRPGLGREGDGSQP